MRGFKMLRKKEREEMFTEIFEDAKEELKIKETVEVIRSTLKESDRMIFDEIVNANKGGAIQFSLTGAGISKDYKKILIKGELLIDIKAADKIMEM